jgi:hypothetical protein
MYSPSSFFEFETHMKNLSQHEIAQVAGGALDPELGLFPKTGIAFIDNIHKAEWKLYGKALYTALGGLVAPKAA